MIRISGGTVVNASGSLRADVLINNATIEAVVDPSFPVEAGTQILDAADMLVIPGGIDPHVHLELPQKGSRSADDFVSGTVAAAWGGTTTVIDFADQMKGQDVLTRLADRKAQADGKCAIDYSFHQVLGDVNPTSLDQVSDVIAAGVPTFKMFMAYPGAYYSDDGDILRGMQRVGELGGMMMMHAENGIAMDVLIEQALERGETDPKYHAGTRPSGLEGEAVHRAIRLAEVANCPLYIVHLSSADALTEVRRGQERGVPVFAETCPQYLFLDVDLLDQGWEGAKYVCSPPLRPHNEADDLWQGLVDDALQLVATDHCPFCFEAQPDLGPQRELGRGDFSAMPNGLGSIEHRLGLLYHGGVAAGRFGAERWVEISSTAPARMFGLAKKGTIAEGYDADVVIFDPNGSTTLSAETHHMNVDYSAYEGTELTGRVRTVMSRGKVIIENDQFLGSAGHGQFVPRQLEGAT